MVGNAGYCLMDINKFIDECSLCYLSDNNHTLNTVPSKCIGCFNRYCLSWGLSSNSSRARALLIHLTRSIITEMLVILVVKVI